MNSYKIPTFFALLLVLLSCSDSSQEVENNTAFERADFLTFVADALIVPSYNTLQMHTNDLLDDLNALRTGVESGQDYQTALQQARLMWYDVALAWQNTHIYDFGPADGSTGTLGQNIATFPVDTVKMQTYVDASDTSFRNFDRDTRGIYAIEYFLFGIENPASLSSNQWDYLLALATHVHEEAANVYAAWESSYRDQFVQSTGTDAGSSTSTLVNAYALSYEAIKNFKLGLPLGLRPGQTQAEPDLVEAFYSGYGLELAHQHLRALEALWIGTDISRNRNGLGFTHYLESVAEGAQLAENSVEALNELNTMLDEIKSNRSKSLSNLIEERDERLINLHNKFQEYTRFFKSDLASLLGVYITYNSGDGD